MFYKKVDYYIFILSSLLLASPSAYSCADSDTAVGINTVMVKEVNITDAEVIERVKSVVSDTIMMLHKLDKDEDYGSISWGNSLTLSSAIEKLQDLLSKRKIKLTKSKIIEYDKIMVEYFTTYIVADLNSHGVEYYNELRSRQKSIIDTVEGKNLDNLKVYKENIN